MIIMDNLVSRVLTKFVELICCVKGAEGAQGGSGNASDFIWKAIWKLKIPGKVKHFFSGVWLIIVIL